MHAGVALTCEAAEMESDAFALTDSRRGAQNVLLFTIQLILISLVETELLKKTASTGKIRGRMKGRRLVGLRIRRRCGRLDKQRIGAAARSPSAVDESQLVEKGRARHLN